MYLGVDWYPEQWGMERVEEDLDGICALGCSMVRLGDFAWDRFEPREGEYDFSFFDGVIARVKARGLSVLLCVPTATMPSWLALAYPEVMRQRENGKSEPYGGRRGYCVNAPRYRERAVALARAMAAHYKDEDAIVAWQVDNEIGHEGSDMCWCHTCHRDFIHYLEGRYGDIEELNRRWGTGFWTQTYNSFDQIPLPRKADTPQNPALRLEWERFRARSAESYLKELTAAVKEEIPGATVLHDFSASLWGKRIDPFAISEGLDAAAYNHYPVWGAQAEAMSPAEAAFALDTARGLKGGNFWITEALIGAQGHDYLSISPKPGEAALWAAQALAHGCSNMLFFRYRGYHKGAEQFCFGVLDADGQRRRKFYEVRDFFARVKPYAQVFTAPMEGRAALVFDYDSAAAWRVQPQSDAMDHEGEAKRLYEPLWRRNITVDVIPSGRDLAPYALVLIPAMVVMDEGFKKRLKDYVQKGGTAVLTFRSGWKDADNSFLLDQRLPAGLTDLVGAAVEEHESLLTGQRREVASPDGRWTGEGRVFCEMLAPTSAQTLLTWSSCPFGDYAAATENRFGAGRCYYLGGSFDDALQEQLFARILAGCGLEGTKTPPGVEVVTRCAGGETYTVTLDHNAKTFSMEKTP